jgi:hypothetical protein
MTDLITYYRQPELAGAVAELIEATNALDLAFDRQEKAIAALAEAYTAIEAE